MKFDIFYDDKSNFSANFNPLSEKIIFRKYLTILML